MNEAKAKQLRKLVIEHSRFKLGVINFLEKMHKDLARCLYADGPRKEIARVLSAIKMRETGKGGGK